MENNQPSEWAMKKARKLFCSFVTTPGSVVVEDIAKELDSLKSGIDSMKTLVDDKNMTIETYFQENKLLKMQIDVLGTQINDYIEKNKLLKSQADELAMALRFYADDSSWHKNSEGKHAVQVDGGKVAMEALSNYRKGE